MSGAPAVPTLLELDTEFTRTVLALEGAAVRSSNHPGGAAPDPSDTECLELFDSQCASRHLDFAARVLRETGRGFYTIGSAGHEGNAAVAAALRVTDPALLHYRSGAFYLQRAKQLPGSDGIRDVLLGLCAASDDPISGGRHKVFGHPGLAIIPQTSTIASHLPRAVGVAFALDRARKLRLSTPWKRDSVVMCSFGDASVNHSTATGAFNSAAYCRHRGLPLPLLFVCEDNGTGISVPTPAGWIRQTFAGRHGIRYWSADGSNVADTLATARECVDWVRTKRAPAFLHLSVPRYLGHAGADVESAYRARDHIKADLARDPLVATASLLVTRGLCQPEQVLDRYEAMRGRVMRTADDVAELPKLQSRRRVISVLARASRAAASAPPPPAAPSAKRQAFFGGKLPEDDGPLTLAQTINRTLGDVLVSCPAALVFGEDVAAKGGVYGVTRTLQKRAGSARVFDTLLDEQAILGLALGAGLSGLLPIPEVQYLAYLHNAEDQLRGEGATLQFFSNGQYSNPMVVRIAGLAYQRGFGGHFHNDNAVGVLRDVPGLIVAIPSHPSDAGPLLRACVGMALAGSLVVYLEPIALYHTVDLHEDGDGCWRAPYAPPQLWEDVHVPLGRARTHGDGAHITIITFGNGLFMSLRVARRLALSGIGARVLDLRWLSPLPLEDIVSEATATGRVLVADETRRSGGVSEGIVTGLVDAGFAGPVARVASEDSFVPLGQAADHVLMQESEIEDAARRLRRHRACRQLRV